MKERVSSGIQQKANKTRVSKTSEISNDNATKVHSHTIKYNNNSTEQYNNGKKEEHQAEDKNERRKESIIILVDRIVKNVIGWEISEGLQQCKVYVKHLSGAKTIHETLFSNLHYVKIQVISSYNCGPTTYNLKTHP